jgi:anti-sigma factor (TIGR02949 family)
MRNGGARDRHAVWLRREQERWCIMTEREIACEQALRQVFEYVDRELGEAEQEAMHQHLQACKSCFSRVEFERRLKDKLGALREDKATPEMNERIKGLLKSF